MARPPLDLSVEIKDADGVVTRLGSEDTDPGNVPRNIQFGTQHGQGFATGGVSLSRRIDRDHVDVHLFDDVTFTGAVGDIAYEGRVGILPRSFSGEHEQSVSLAGHMAHAADRTMAEVYVDRDLGSWGPPSRNRQIDLVANSWITHGHETAPDILNGLPALKLAVTGPWPATRKPICEPWYDAGPGSLVAKVYYDYQNNADVSSGDADWLLQLFSHSTDAPSIGAATSVTADLAWAGPNGTYAALTTPQRYVFWDFLYNVAAAGLAVDYGLFLRNLAVYGDHGLDILGTAPGGVSASDVIRHSAGKYCPLLNTRGVLDTTYPIPHLPARDIKPFELWERVNAYHLWNLAVWEQKTLHFAPADLTDYDWEIRLDDDGTTVDLQGDSTEDLRNGIVVIFDNVATGAREVLTPTDHAELADASVENPATRHGITKWGDPFTLSFPTTRDAALQLGRLALAEANAPKAPGSITKQGHIRDRAGHWQPVWKVRADDRVVITSSTSLSDRPRLIRETSYSHDSKSVTIGVDSTLQRLEAITDRITTALSAANLT